MNNFFVSAVVPIECGGRQLEQITLTPIIQPSQLDTTGQNWTMPLGSFVFLTNRLGSYTYLSQWAYNLNAIGGGVDLATQTQAHGAMASAQGAGRLVGSKT